MILGVFLLLPLLVVTRGRFQVIVLTAYLVRVGLSLAHTFVYPLPDSQEDALRFEMVAWRFAVDGECWDDARTGSYMYSWVASCIYRVVGRSPLALQMLNSFAGAMIVLLSMKTVRIVRPGERVDLSVGWFLAFYPSLVLYSAITMREVAITLPLGLAVYFLLKWDRSTRYRYAVCSLLSVLLSQLSHAGMISATVAIGTLILYRSFFVHWRRLGNIRFGFADVAAAVGSLVVIGLGIGVISMMTSGGHGLEKLGLIAQDEVVSGIAELQERAARGRAAYLVGSEASSALQIALQLPLRVLFFVGSPFIWQVNRLADVMVFLDGVFLSLLMAALVVQVRRGAWRVRNYLMLLIVLGAIVMAFAIATSNYGAAFRHRAKLVPTAIILYAVGRSYTESKPHPTNERVTDRRDFAG